MIKIIGEEGTSEYRAALIISNFFEEQWPNISNTPEEEDLVIIRAGAIISGYKRNEIDLFIVARLSQKRSIKPVRAIRDRTGRPIRDKNIFIKNIIAVGEEKSHSVPRIKAIGDEIQVYYNKTGWKSATSQNIEQLHSVNKYLKDYQLKGFLCRFVFVSNVAGRFGAAIHPTMKSGEFFSRLIESGSATVNQNGTRFEYSSTSEEFCRSIFRLPIVKEVKPSRLDRGRMELLARKEKLVRSLSDEPPKSLTQLAGVGGTGKTIVMLQVASQIHKTKGERSLFLTYNVTLAADVQRLLSLARIHSEDKGGGIRVQTVYSFFYTLLDRLKLSESRYGDGDNYNDHLQSLASIMELLKEDPSFIQELISENRYDFEFDRIFVDEAQDWHQIEAELLKLVFCGVPICVADGKQQMIRTDRKANWFQGVDKSKRRFETFNKSLRQKSSLANFISGLSKKFEQDWDAEANHNAPGGRIIVTKTDYRQTNLHQRLCKEATKANVDNIDWLFLVPPMSVTNSEPRTSDMSNYLNNIGGNVLDLFESPARKEIQPDPQKFRVMQYESCRGLEGWVVVLHRFDAFLTSKIALFSDKETTNPKRYNELGLEEKEKIWNWMSMVLARAMDTVVIHLENPSSGIGRDLFDFCQINRDAVELE